MKFIAENWPVLVGILALAGAGALFGVRFLNLPNDQQLQNIKSWLLWAVIQAEKELGGGTGKLKLAMVYDMFIAKFPAVAAVLSYERFSGLVDDALGEMRKMLETNKAIALFVTDTI